MWPLNARHTPYSLLAANCQSVSRPVDKVSKPVPIQGDGLFSPQAFTESVLQAVPLRLESGSSRQTSGRDVWASITVTKTFRTNQASRQPEKFVMILQGNNTLTPEQYTEVKFQVFAFACELMMTSHYVS